MMNGLVEEEEVLSLKVNHIDLNSSDDFTSNFEEKSPVDATQDPARPSRSIPADEETGCRVDGSPTCSSPSEEVKVILKHELEGIFSQENFSKDKFLISQLDSDQYISLDIIMQLKPIECLTKNADLILELLKELPNLQVDLSNTKVRLATPRSTIILREVPQSTPKEDIQELFVGPDCPSCVRCEFAGNENWYVTFLTEDDAHKAYNHLREGVQSFLGKPIMARIKTSNTFIPSSGAATVDALNRYTHGSSSTSPGNTDLHHHPHANVFSSSQASAGAFPNYQYMSHAFPVYTSDLIAGPMWQQKFMMEQYNMPVCPDFVYAQPIYNYSAQDGISMPYESNSRSHKSSSAHFRTGGHHYQHRSHPEQGGLGGYFHRYGGSHNENRPPPRFLKQQLASSALDGIVGDCPPDFSGDRFSTERIPVDSRPAQNVASVRCSLAGFDRHVPNGFLKPAQPSKSPDDKDQESSSYHSKGRKFQERRGGYRGSRKTRNMDEGDRIIKGRQTENHLKSPKAKDTSAFLLESSSFPPLSSLSAAASAQPSNPPSTAAHATAQASYVQAVANSSCPAHSYDPPQQKLPQAAHVINSSSASLSFASSTPLLHRPLNNGDDGDDAADISDGSCKMPLVKLSYAQIAQRTKFSAAPKNQEGENVDPGATVSASSKSVNSKYSKNDKTSEKSTLALQQQQQQASWNKRKSHFVHHRKNTNGENSRTDQFLRNVEENGCEAVKRREIDDAGRSLDKHSRATVSALSHRNSVEESKEVEGRFVVDEA